jgi:hypothetical protein
MPRGAKKKENPRRQVTYKLPPALVDRIKREHKRRGCKDQTQFVERALYAALGATEPLPDAEASPEPAEPPEPRANAAVDLDARTAAFRQATRR